MPFVHDLFERINHLGLRARRPAHTLSDHVEELRERQEQSQARRDADERARRVAAAEQHARAQTAPRTTGRRPPRRPAPGPTPDEPPTAVEDDAASRWLPRRP